MALNPCVQDEFPARPLQEEEILDISYRALLLKQVITVLMICFVIYYLVQPPDHNIFDIVFFDCDPNSTSSILVKQEIQKRADRAEIFCKYKTYMGVLSVALMLPIVLDVFTQSVFIVLLPSTQVPVANGEIAMQGHKFSLRTKRWWLVLLCLILLLILMGLIAFRVTLRRFLDTVKIVAYCIVAVWTAWGVISCLVAGFSGRNPLRNIAVWATIVAAPDLTLAMLLLVISPYVVLQSGSNEEILVNIVALQIYATLDDQILKMLATPRASVGETIKGILISRPDTRIPDVDCKEEKSDVVTTDDQKV